MKLLLTAIILMTALSFSAPSGAGHLSDIRFKENLTIALYPGTFDPPHSGHIEIAMNLIRLGLADYVLFIPNNKVFRKPHASSFEVRWEMSALTFDQNKRILVPDTFHPERSLIATAMDAILERFPEAQFVGVIGLDNLLRPNVEEEIIEPEIDGKISQWIVNLRPGYQTDQKRETLNGAPIHYAQFQEGERSSTEIRRSIHDGPIHLDPVTYTYIVTKGLYGTKSCTNNLAPNTQPE